MIDEELKKSLAENKQLLDDIEKRIHRIEKKFALNTVFGVIKFLIIFSPLIFAIIYFTPILKDYVSIFNPVIDTLRSGKNELLNAGNEGNTLEGAMLESFCDEQSREAMIRQFCKE